MFPEIVSSIKSFISSQKITLFRHFDPLKNAQTENPINSQLNLAFMLLFVFISYLDGMLGLHYEHGGNFNLGGLIESRFVFLHQVVPVKIWLPSDIICNLNTLASLLVYAAMMHRSKWPPRLILRPFDESKSLKIDKVILPAEVSRKIVKTSENFRKIAQFIVYTFTGAIVGYCYSNVIIHGIFRWSFHTMFFWAFQFPLYFLYVVYGKLS